MIATMTSVRRASPADVDSVADILTRGFFNDPVVEWIFPDLTTRAKHAYDFFRLFGGVAIEAGDTFVDGDRSSAAIWLPVDPANPEPDDEAFGEQLAEPAGVYADRLFQCDEIMKSLHPDHTEHSYLHLVATVPAKQGQGIGRKLLSERLRELDASSMPAYLEATTIQSARLYRSLGFEHLGYTIDLPDGPSMYPMWREPVR